MALSLQAPSATNAFMTWNSPGNAEHERITRLALACNSALQRPVPDGLSWAEDLCLASNSTSSGISNAELVLRMLAGADHYLGGVGAPDRLAEVLSSSDRAHCDNGDAWFAAQTWPENQGRYPRSSEQRATALKDCLSLMQRYVALSVQQAGLLVNAVGTVDAPQADLSEDCNIAYDPDLAPDNTHSRGWAKCNALISFGRALHIVQDFFAHSNWVDANLHAPGPDNPPGLQNASTTLPDALHYPRSQADLDAFLSQFQVITGGYPTPGCPLLKPDCELPPTRMYHDKYLNKDEGDGNIDWTTLGIPKGDGGHSHRAAAGTLDGQDNFQRAVRAAALASAALWVDFRAAILKAYPGSRGERIWAALRGSTPWTACRQEGDARRSMSPPNGETSARRTIRVRVSNRSDAPLPCGTARLDYGEWSSLPPDRIDPKETSEFLVLSNGDGVRGSVQLGPVTFTFSNPVIGSNTFSCLPTNRCSMQGGSGNDATVDLIVATPGGASDGSHSLTVAVPGREALGARGGQPATTDDRAQRGPEADIKPALSPAERQRVQGELANLQVCGGQASRIQLRVAEISCDEAQRLLLSGSDAAPGRSCPPRWSPLQSVHSPSTPNAVICYQSSASDSRIPNARAQILGYVRPH